MMQEEPLDRPHPIRRRCRKTAGRVLGAPYAGIMRVRRWAYRRGLLPGRSAGVPVICVGNLTTGGTGKTPMVAWTVRRLREAGRTAAILTRGYKAVRGMSDEAELLRKLTGANVVVNPDRVAGAKTAVTGGADVLVMDDGFQHLRLRRDLDIVLIDATFPFGGGCCLPLGRLREPVAALRDADAIVVTRCDQVSLKQWEDLRNFFTGRFPNKLFAAAAHKPVGVKDEKGEFHAPQALAGKSVFAFCGIGNPDGFLQNIVELEAAVVGSLALPDHVDYTARRIEEINRSAEKCDVDILLTTEKDAVKLAGADLDKPLWQVAVEMDLIEGAEALTERIGAVAGGKC
jgi:tetraacyldisaccharide 4'-kinase